MKRLLIGLLTLLSLSSFAHDGVTDVEAGKIMQALLNSNFVQILTLDEQKALEEESKNAIANYQLPFYEIVQAEVSCGAQSNGTLKCKIDIMPLEEFSTGVEATFQRTTKGGFKLIKAMLDQAAG